MPTPAETLQKALGEYAPSTRQEALIALRNYHEGRVQFPPDQLTVIYRALQDLSCQGITEHKGDKHRKDRQFGQRLRKKRTGSRRG